jgi:phytoene dehydrogenase-like protein
MQNAVIGTAARGGGKTIVVVGAGLAGLTCAKVLAEAGREVVVLEAGDEPGGRVASIVHPDGYILDRGFQVLLDSYPMARRHLDLRALGGGRFRAGALLVGRGRPVALENPLFRPAAVAAIWRAGAPRWGDQWRMGLLMAGALLQGPAALARAAGSPEDVAGCDLLAAQGFSEDFMDRLARPFLGGVLLDPELGTSGAWMMACLARFATGRALLPGGGMGAIGRQLAAALPPGTVRHGCRVGALRMSGGELQGVELAEGGLVGGAAVVLATDEPATCRLLGRGTPRGARATAVHYFTTRSAWHRGAWLCLPPRSESGPVLHAALLTNAAPSLAPPGRHLWSVTVLPGHPEARNAEAVAARVAGWFGRGGAELMPLDFLEVAYAVPVQPPGFAGRPAPWGELPRGVLVAGDSAAGASIDATMASGEAAARRLLSPARGN